jgi:FHS family L-fucose permease-like MFS transporter
VCSSDLGYAGVICLVLISGFMSLMFPTIYGITVEGLGSQTKVASSGLIMAILGGALFSTIQGQVSDMTDSINLSFYVPLTCFAIIAVYALTIRKKTA